MNKYRRFGSLTSSVNPNELATSVVGIIRFLAGTAAALGIVTATDVEMVNVATQSLLEQVAIIVPAGIAIYGICETLFGLFRKVAVYLFDRER